MFRKLGTMALIAAISASGMLIVGCASTSETHPYSLTGSSVEQEQAQRMRYTDEKGRYHPELRSAGIPLHQVATE